MSKWISVNKELPNEDEIYYDGVGIGGERNISDRVLVVDKDGWIRIGYFIKSCKKHKYKGKRIRNKYSDYGVASWEFGNSYKDKKVDWIVGDSEYTPIAWQPLPIYKAESEEEE